MLNRALVEQEYGYLHPEVYLNIASEARPPMRVRKAITEFVDICYPVSGKRGLKPIVAETAPLKQAFSQLIHAEGADQIALVKNTTEGMGIISQGYPFAPEDNIVICQMEHPACIFPWVNLAEKYGVKIRAVHKDIRQVTPDDIFARVDGNTKAVVISAVQYSTGYFADLQQIGRRCRERGIIFAVDAIQALGRMKLDVQQCCIDFLTAGGQKGLLGIPGMGFVYCAPWLVNKIKPPYAGIQGTTMRGNPDILEDLTRVPWRDTAERFESGITDYIALHALSESVPLLLELGIENIQEHILTLEKQLRGLLVPYGDAVVTFADEKRCSGIVSVALPAGKEEFAGRILKERMVTATIRNGNIRFGIGLHNTPEDMVCVAEAVAQIFAE